MRITSLIIVVSLAGWTTSTATAANECAPTHPPAAPSMQHEASAGTCKSSSTSPGTGAQLVQFAPESCSLPGQRICLNGWVAVCQCYSYGCNYMATAVRCR